MCYFVFLEHGCADNIENSKTKGIRLREVKLLAESHLSIEWLCQDSTWIL